jgi:hypothetical protein
VRVEYQFASVLFISLVGTACQMQDVQSTQLANPTKSLVGTPAPVPTVSPTPKPSPSPTPKAVLTCSETQKTPCSIPVDGRVHHLGEIAQFMGKLSDSNYNTMQDTWLATTEPACNFFVATALFADNQGSTQLLDLLAADYGPYLLNKGWVKSTLAEVKALFESGADFDVIMNRPGTSTEVHGHILIPVGVATDGNIIAAEGELDSISHEVVEETDDYLLNYNGGMAAFVLR